jgi:hypothetical protein
MAGRSAVWTATQTSEQYLVNMEGRSDAEPASSVPHLVEAKLQLDRRSLRAQEIRIWVREQHVTHEYRYVEAGYERLPNTDRNNAVFFPDRDIDPVKGYHAAPKLRLNSGGNSHAAHLELEALLCLHALGEDAGQQILIERKQDNRLLVHGVVASTEEAGRIRTALTGLGQDSMFEVRVYSVNEIRDRRRQGQVTELDEITVDSGQSLASSVLRSHFQSLGYQGKALDDQVEQFTQSTLSKSAKLLQQAWNLRDFSRGFSGREVSEFSPEDKRAWFTLLADHVESLSGSLEDLRKRIEWLAPPNKTITRSQAPSDISGSTPISSAVDDALDQATEVDRRLRALLLVSVTPEETGPTRFPDIQAPLSAAESDVGILRSICKQYSASFQDTKQ